MGYQTDFTWNDLLIEILNMTPEERKEHVCVSDDSLLSDPQKLYGLTKMYNEIFLSTSKN
jgi:hypothetical protein